MCLSLAINSQRQCGRKEGEEEEEEKKRKKRIANTIHVFFIIS